MSELATTLSAMASFSALLGVVVLWVTKIAKMELKIDTIWDFQMRRAMNEAILQGVAIKNSPVIVTEEAKRWMRPLVIPIRDFYRRLGRHLSDAELALEIERRFGQQILEEVCIPHGLHQGACLLIAVEAAKDDAA